MKKLLILLLLSVFVGCSTETLLPEIAEEADAEIAVEIESPENGENDEGYGNDNDNDSEVAGETTEISGFKADAIAFADHVERYHPIFVMPELLADNYDKIREEFIRAAGEADNLTEFAFAMQHFATVLRDGHMSNISYRAIEERKYLDANFVMRESRLYLIQDDESDWKVVSIGGIAAYDIFQTIGRYFYFENETDRNFIITQMSRSVTLLEWAGAQRDGEFIAISLYREGQYNENLIEIMPTPFRIPPVRPDYVIRTEMLEGNVFLIDLRTFVDDPGIAEAENAIREAIDNGMRHFILDLRDNRGGNSFIGTRLFSAMGISHPGFGGVRRSAPGRPGASHSDRSTASRNPNDVIVAVLSNAETFSSGRWPVAWVIDGDLGIVVGEPPRNAPTAFGNMGNPITLEYTGIQAMLSTTRWLRPDRYADQTTLWPDIQVDPRYALEAALEFFASLEG